MFCASNGIAKLRLNHPDPKESVLMNSEKEAFFDESEGTTE